jgi:DNA invertase Pin-like site-specific DNA recombinase
MNPRKHSTEAPRRSRAARPAVAPETVYQIQQAVRFSNRSRVEIARHYGISRYTLWRILKHARQPAKPIGRCQSCGAVVLLPCMACALQLAARQSPN